jgi:hypothetical protein
MALRVQRLQLSLFDATAFDGAPEPPQEAPARPRRKAVPRHQLSLIEFIRGLEAGSPLLSP